MLEIIPEHKQTTITTYTVLLIYTVKSGKSLDSKRGQKSSTEKGNNQQSFEI